MLDAVGAHLSNAQIAGRLHISVRTVESHVSSLLRKFGAADRWAIAAEVAVVAAHPDAAQRLAAAGPVGQENLWAAACLARARGQLLADRAALAESVAGWERIGARFERACTLLLPDRAAEGRAELTALGCPRPPRKAGRDPTASRHGGAGHGPGRDASYSVHPCRNGRFSRSADLPDGFAASPATVRRPHHSVQPAAERQAQPVGQ